MNQERQIDLVRRVLAHVEAKTTDADPAGRTLPIDRYADETRLSREIGVLFKDLPVAIAHASEIPNPGDFLTHNDSGTPLLVVRRDDGGVDAFLNVCRHRGTRVESAPRGNKRAFSCPYHGWTYGKRGQLVTIPHAHGFANCIDKSSRGLVRAAAEQVAGLIFVRPRGLRDDEPEDGSSLDIRTHLGSIAGDLEGFGLGDANSTTICPRVITPNISWKLAIDIFLETYHLRPTHKDTIYPMFFDNLGLVDRVGPHLRNVFPKRSIRELATAAPDTWKLRVHANVLYHLFPSTLVLIQPDHAAVLHVWPLPSHGDGLSRSMVASYMVIPERADTDKARAYWKANADILYGATDEDFTMGESIEKGLRCGANREVVFGAYEHALSHFHDGIERHVTSSTSSRDH